MWYARLDLRYSQKLLWLIYDTEIIDHFTLRYITVICVPDIYIYLTTLQSFIMCTWVFLSLLFSKFCTLQAGPVSIQYTLIYQRVLQNEWIIGSCEWRSCYCTFSDNWEKLNMSCPKEIGKSRVANSPLVTKGCSKFTPKIPPSPSRLPPFLIHPALDWHHSPSQMASILPQYTWLHWLLIN